LITFEWLQLMAQMRKIRGAGVVLQKLLFNPANRFMGNPFDFYRMHWDREPAAIFRPRQQTADDSPLPAGEGRGEGESFERESRSVHGEGELSERERRSVHGEGESFEQEWKGERSCFRT
jgi:hypothetical protein